MKTSKNKNKSLFNEKNSKLKASDNMFEVGEKIVSEKNLLPNVLTENEAVYKEIEEVKQWRMDEKYILKAYKKSFKEPSYDINKVWEKLNENIKK